MIRSSSADVSTPSSNSPTAVAILRGLRAVMEPRTAVTAAVTVYVSPSAAITGMPAWP